jgi:uncharacterized iron-regulated membrane protein
MAESTWQEMSMKAWFLRVHRWLALLFALPFAVVIVTGLILSFEPWLVTRAVEPGTMSSQKVQGLLSQHDPSGQARAISYRSYDDTLTIGAGRGGGVVIDVESGEIRASPSSLANLLGTARRLHETLLIEAGWLVIVSTTAMLVIALLGILMGWPRFANTLTGWHKATAWGLLPLVILSPLTGLLIAAGVTFISPPPASGGQGTPLKLAEAVEILGRDRDLSALIWLRPQGGRILARLAEDGEYRLYGLTAAGATPLERNWPRLWHEGNFAGAWSAAMNVILSVAMIVLLVTGVWIWSRRELRRRTRRLSRAAAN